MSSFSPSPGLTVVFCAVGFLFLVFGIWAIYKFLLPNIGTHTGTEGAHLPQVEQRRPIDRTLHKSLYSQHNLLNLTDPRNTVEDYDLKNSRYSTNIFDLNGSRPGSAARSRPSSSHAHSRSRSRTRDLNDLRSSLYAEPGLLSSDARSAYFNLVLDQPDVLSQPPTPRPTSLYGLRSDANSTRSGVSKRDPGTPVSELLHLRNSLYSENNPFISPESANASITDLIASKGYFDSKHSSSTPNAHLSANGYGFYTSPRHSLPGTPGTGTMTPNSAFMRRRESAPDSGMNTPGSATPGPVYAVGAGPDARRRLLEAANAKLNLVASPKDLQGSKIKGGEQSWPPPTTRPGESGKAREKGGRPTRRSYTAVPAAPTTATDEKVASARIETERTSWRRSVDAATGPSPGGKRRARSAGAPLRQRARSQEGRSEYTGSTTPSIQFPAAAPWSPVAPPSQKDRIQPQAQWRVALPYPNKQPDCKGPTLPHVTMPSMGRTRSATPNSPPTPVAMNDPVIGGIASDPRDAKDLVRERSFDRFSIEAKADGDGDGDGEWPLQNSSTPRPSIPTMSGSALHVGNSASAANTMMAEKERMLKAWRYRSMPTTPHASALNTSTSPGTSGDSAAPAIGGNVDYLSHLNIQSPPGARSPSPNSRTSLSTSSPASHVPPPQSESKDLPNQSLPSSARPRRKLVKRMTMPVPVPTAVNPSVKIIRPSLDDEERGRSPLPAALTGMDEEMIAKRVPFIERAWLGRSHPS